MAESNLEFIAGGPFGFVVEKDPIDVAVVLASRQEKGRFTTSSTTLLLDCVVLDPRYIPSRLKDYELMKVRGRRLGRTIDILLDEPIRVNETGEEYHVLTFKGCGAAIDGESDKEEMVINPYVWQSSNVQQIGRIWGAVTEAAARIETQKDLSDAQKLGLLITPYLFANTIPKEVLKNIFNKGDVIPLAQPLRLCKTNIMPSDLFTKEQSYSKFDCLGLNQLLSSGVGDGTVSQDDIFKYVSKDLIIENILSIIHSLAKTCKGLNEKGKVMSFTVPGSVVSNTYISGEFKDLENISIKMQDEETDSEMMETAYQEVMMNLQTYLSENPGKHRVFAGYSAMRKYVLSGGEGPTIIRLPKKDIAEKVLFVDDAEFNLPPFGILGFPRKDGNGFTWDISESCIYMKLENAITLDKKLREDGYQLATRAHIVSAWNSKKQYWRDYFRQESTTILSLSAFDFDTRRLYDGLVLDQDGKLDVSSSEGRLLLKQEQREVTGWDSTGWPLAVKDENPLGPPGCLCLVGNDTRVSNNKGIFPVAFKIDEFPSYGSLWIDAGEYRSDRAIPLVVFEYTN